MDTLTNEGRSKLKDVTPAAEIPQDMYDCGDGFYDPKTCIVYNYNMEYLRNAGMA